MRQPERGRASKGGTFGGMLGWREDTDGEARRFVSDYAGFRGPGAEEDGFDCEARGKEGIDSAEPQVRGGGQRWAVGLREHPGRAQDTEVER